MAGAANIHHGDTEVTKTVGGFPEDYVFAFILGVLCASVVKIHAKQSQFRDSQMKLNRRSLKGLGEADVKDARAKTKPISGRGLTSPHSRLCTGGFETRPYLRRASRRRDEQGLVQNKANLPEGKSRLTGVWKESYEKRRRTTGVRKQSQFPGPRWGRKRSGPGGCGLAGFRLVRRRVTIEWLLRPQL